MKILFLGAFKTEAFRTRFGAVGDSELGGQRKMSLLLRALVRGGHSVRVLSSAIGRLNRIGLQRPKDECVQLTEGVINVTFSPTLSMKPLGGFLICLSSLLTARRIVGEWKPDLVISYNALLAEALVLKRLYARLRIPYIIEVDDLPGVRARGLNPKPWLDRSVWPWVASSAGGFILVNSALLSRIKIDGRPTLVCPGIVDSTLIEKARLRPRAFSRDRATVLYAGGLSEARGFRTLLNAIPLLPEGFSVKIAGDGPMRCELQRLCDEMPEHCSYLGLLAPDRMFEEMVDADVVVNTPEALLDQSGVFPFKIFEYLACGAHVVSSKLPDIQGFDIKWIQRWDGTPSGLRQRLLSARCDAENESDLRQRCQRWVSENYSIGGVGESVSRLIADVVGNKLGQAVVEK